MDSDSQPPSMANGERREPTTVRSMFDAIASRYDLVNTIASAGSDGRWRRRAVSRLAPRPGERILDLACGTGKLSLEIRRQGALVVGLDFSAMMLRQYQLTSPDAMLVRSDALQLPFAAASFEACSIAFGLRNLHDPRLGLAEMRRVLRPGGRLLILEFLRPPKTPMSMPYRFYVDHFLPLLGGRVSGERQAYEYLSDTIDTYMDAREMALLVGSCGFSDPQVEELNMRSVAIVAAHSS